MSYSQKLKDPRWQKKRLEIFQRDNFQCKCCGSKNKTLHVHHLCYFKGNEPWDYEDIFLTTLCADCHDTFHNENGFSEYFLKKKFDELSFALENHGEQTAHDIGGVLAYFGVDQVSIPARKFEVCKMERKYLKEEREIFFKIIKEVDSDD